MSRRWSQGGGGSSSGGAETTLALQFSVAGLGSFGIDGFSKPWPSDTASSSSNFGSDSLATTLTLYL